MTIFSSIEIKKENIFLYGDIDCVKIIFDSSAAKDLLILFNMIRNEKLDEFIIGEKKFTILKNCVQIEMVGNFAIMIDYHHKHDSKFINEVITSLLEKILNKDNEETITNDNSF